MLNSLLADPRFTSTAPFRTLSASPLGFVDVGARGGAHPLVEPIAGITAVLGFDPDSEECARLNEQLKADGAWAAFRIEPVALAGTRGDATLYLLSTDTSHSLRPPNGGFTARYNMRNHQLVDTTTVPTTTLDEAIFHHRDESVSWGELLKLDTQGTEYEILTGAERTLAERTVCLFVEVEFCPLYAGQYLFSDVERFLRDHGFSFYGFAGLHHRSRRLLDKRIHITRERPLYADAVFFKDPLPGAAHPVSLSPRAVHVLFTCALVLGYHDFALELALATWATAEEAARVTSLVHHLATIPPNEAVSAVETLSRSIRTSPEDANVIVGHFVDERRSRCDYDDLPRLPRE